MNRQEFIDTVTTWGELVSFCTDEGIDFCDDIYSDDDLDSYIDAHLNELCDDECWQDVRDILYDIPQGYDYYQRVEYTYMEFTGLSDEDDEFRVRKDDILEYMDTNGLWDDTDDEDNDDEEVVSADEFESDSSVSLGDFFASTVEAFDKIVTETAKIEAMANADFDKFTQQVTTVGGY